MDDRKIYRYIGKSNEYMEFGTYYLAKMVGTELHVTYNGDQVGSFDPSEYVKQDHEISGWVTVSKHTIYAYPQLFTKDKSYPIVFRGHTGFIEVIDDRGHMINLFPREYYEVEEDLYIVEEEIEYIQIGEIDMYSDKEFEAGEILFTHKYGDVHDEVIKWIDFVAYFKDNNEDVIIGDDGEVLIKKVIWKIL